jgi:hypothetical protein
MEQTLHYFQGVTNLLEVKLDHTFASKPKPVQTDMIEENAPTTATPVTDAVKEKFTELNLYHLIISNIFIFSLRFFMSHKTNKLHLLKNKLYLEDFDSQDVSPVEKLNNVVKSLKKFVKTLKGLMTEKFSTDYLDLLKKIACLIGNKSEKIVNKSIKDGKERIKAKQYLATLAFDILKELINYDDAESQTIDVLYSFLSTVRFTSQFMLKNKQTMLSKKLNAYYNDRMNHTNKKWNLFVDACCQYIKDKKIDYVKAIENDSDQINKLTQRMLSI